MQRASKHYKESTLISKQKYPIKQRKYVKKCKIQRQRKQIYEQLIFELFDYNEYDDEYEYEYEYEHGCEYYQHEYEYYNDYYRSQHIQNEEHIKDNEFQSKLDGIDVDVKYYCIDDPQHSEIKDEIITEWPCPRCTLIQPLMNKSCRLCNEPQPKFYKDINLKNKHKKQQEIITVAATSVKIYKNNVNIETKNTEQSMMIFEDFRSFFNNETSFKKIQKTLTENIINKSIKTFKGTIKNGNILKLFKGIKTSKIVKNMQIVYTYSNNYNNQTIGLKDVLYKSIPDLWFIYDCLCQYVGYKWLNIFVSATAKIRYLNTLRTYDIIKKHQTSNSGHGISYSDANKSQTNIKYSHLYKKSYITENKIRHKRNKPKNINTDFELRELYDQLHTLRDKIYELKLNIFQLEVYRDAGFVPNCLRKKVNFRKSNHRCEYFVENILWKARHESLCSFDGRLTHKRRELLQTNRKYKIMSKLIIDHKLSKLENDSYNTQQYNRIRNNFENKCNLKEVIKKEQLKKEQQKILFKCDKLFNKIHLKINNDEYLNLLKEAKQNENVLFNQENNEMKDRIYLIYDDIYDDYYDKIDDDLCCDKYDICANINSVILDEKIRRKIVNKFGNDTDKKRLKYRNKAIKNYENRNKNRKT